MDTTGLILLSGDISDIISQAIEENFWSGFFTGIWIVIEKGWPWILVIIALIIAKNKLGKK